jgi:hypothetical protein
MWGRGESEGEGDQINAERRSESVRSSTPVGLKNVEIFIRGWSVLSTESGFVNFDPVLIARDTTYDIIMTVASRIGCKCTSEHVGDCISANLINLTPPEVPGKTHDSEISIHILPR